MLNSTAGRILAASFILTGTGMMHASPIVFSATSTTAAGIQATVDDFRGSLGGVLNPPGVCTPGPCTSGRREVNWDAVPTTAFNPFPGDFFNNNGTLAARTRGLVLTPPTDGSFQVDNNVNQFGFPGNFPSFSPQLVFAALSPTNSTFTIQFAVPGQPGNAATTNGFGIVFLDVETANTTAMRFFDVNGALVHTAFAPANAASGAFSFLGVSFTSERIARIEVTAGSGGFCTNGTADCVAMDDFIYGEPQSQIPEPSTVTFTLAGLGGMLLYAARRRRQA
jgi:hypothetical protein